MKHKSKNQNKKNTTSMSNGQGHSKRVHSIKLYMLVVFIILILTISVSTTVISILKSQDNIANRTESKIDYYLLQNSDYLNNWIGTQKHIINSLEEETLLTKSYDNKEAYKTFLAGKQEKYPYVLSFYMGFADNEYIDSTDWTPPADYIVSQRDWYKQAIQAEGAIVTDPYIDADTGGLVLTVAQKVQGADGAIGVIGMDIKMDTIIDVMKNSVSPEGAYAFVVNSSNDVIMHPEEFFPEENMKFKNLVTDYGDTYTQLVENLASNTPEQIAQKNYNGEMRYYDFLPIADTSWKVVLSFPHDYLSEEIVKDIVTSIIIFGVMLALSAIVIMWFVKKYISPLDKVCDELDMISKGNLAGAGGEIPVASMEVLHIKTSMDHMKEMLNSYIGEISTVMERLSRGYLDITIQRQYVGDFEEIRHSIVATLDSLRNAFSEITLSSNMIAEGSSQVSGGAQSLAQGATEQASSVQQLYASVNSVSSGIKQTADNSKKANEIATQAAQAIAKSNEQMKNLIAAMNNIHEKSGEIHKIIKTIEDIAFQTNVLALNAAVEAARAGEAGKGFAVVADEVRNLAGKSAQAAKNTTRLIEDSVGSIDLGVELTSKTAKELFEAVEDVNLTTKVLAEISEATGMQSEAIEQIMAGVEQISGVVQTNSATSEISAASSKELSGQADLLKRLVSKFRTE